MEINIVSKEIIKPSSIHHKNPFKISLLDQVTPSSYSPLIIFYLSTTKNNIGHISSATHRLKTSLSQTLTRFYPLSGRLKDNLFIDNFDQGVPFIESRVRSEMTHFLRQPQMDSLNHLLPCRPFAPGPDTSSMPQMAVQVNVFDCGSLAIGLSMSHKLMDGVTSMSFLKSWAAVARGEENHENHTSTRDGNGFEAPSVVFPPMDPHPLAYLQMAESQWFGQSRMRVRRFVFSAEAIAALRTKARSDSVINPTRNEALSSFIWGRFMSASRTVSGSSDRLSALTLAVNLRPRTEPRMSSDCIGNVVWLAGSTTRNASDKALPLLVKRVRQSVQMMDDEFVKSLQVDIKNKLWEAYMGEEDPERLLGTNWAGFSPKKVDFGWGVPIWVGGCGEVDSKFMNMFVLKKINAIEDGLQAWVILGQDVMDVMEKDPEFLAYACLNPPVISSI